VTGVAGCVERANEEGGQFAVQQPVPGHPRQSSAPPKHILIGSISIGIVIGILIRSNQVIVICFLIGILIGVLVACLDRYLDRYLDKYFDRYFDSIF
jgi:hypothetical protein